jgi:hypothetical protein
VREQRIAVGDQIISRRNAASIDVWHPTDEASRLTWCATCSNAFNDGTRVVFEGDTYDSRSVCVRSGQLWRAASWVSCTRECTPSLV